MKLAAAVALLLAVGTEPAVASIMVAKDVRQPALRVDAQGNAEVSWVAGGARRYILVPANLVVHRPVSRPTLPGRDVSRPAPNVRLAFSRLVKRTPDGRYWALQAWRPLKGGPLELHFSRWRGAPTKVTLSAVPSGDTEALEGRATFAGRPVHGFSRMLERVRVRHAAFLDCFGCRTGRGWARFLAPALRRNGSFRVVIRPAWRGSRYRVTVAGPNRGWTLAPDASATTRSILEP